MFYPSLGSVGCIGDMNARIGLMCDTILADRLN